MSKVCRKRRLADVHHLKENVQEIAEDNDEDTAEENANKMAKWNLEHCRLRHDLNADCLCSIFDYLSIVDLIRISQFDTYFLELIRERVIGKKLANFKALLRLPKRLSDSIYKEFGKYMRKILVKSDLVCRQKAMNSFKHFLIFITTYCSPNLFTEVELDFNLSAVEDQNLIRISVPYFSKVHTLTLRTFSMDDKNFEFFSSLGHSLKDLRTLTLDEVHVRLYSLSDAEKFDLSVFLKSKTKLKTFNFTGQNDVSPKMAEALKQDCTNLETFAHILLLNHYRNVDTISDKMKNRYNYVSEIVNLKNVTMTSHTLCGSDLCDVLQKLAAKNKLRTLKVYIDIDQSFELSKNEQLSYVRESFSHFTSLTTIEIKIESDRIDNHDMKFYFLCHFMSTLKSLHQVRIISKRINNINQILEMVPSIRVMCLAQVTMKYLPVEMKKIVRSAKKIREQHLQFGKHRPLLHLILSRRQWREVQVYKDIDSIITSEIDDTNYYGIGA